MTLDALQTRLKQAFQNQCTDTDSAHDIAHLDRVWLNAQRISKGEGAGSLRILIAAAYLHDLVNLPKNHPDRATASTLSSKAAEPVLSDLGYTPDKITQVAHAIIAHSYSANIAPQTLEAKILQDADRLDALGAIGIARTFGITGALGHAIYDPNDPFARNRALDDTTFAMDHWPLKLLRLPDMMNTATAKTIATSRLDLMQKFLTQLSKELGTSTPDHWLP